MVAHAPPKELLVFENVLEGMRTALKTRMTSATRARFKTLGVDFEQKLKPMYPLEVWISVIEAARETCFARLPAKEGFRALGEAFIEGYRHTLIGRPVLAMTKLLGVKRTLGRMTQNFRSGTNYSVCTLTERGPTHFDLWVNEVSRVPEFTSGILVAGLTHAGAKNLRVEVVDYDGRCCTYRIDWEA